MNPVGIFKSYLHLFDFLFVYQLKLQSLIKSIATNYEWGNVGAIMVLSIALKRKIISINQLAESKLKKFTNG
jgi:hypothetical protein